MNLFITSVYFPYYSITVLKHVQYYFKKLKKGTPIAKSAFPQRIMYIFMNILFYYRLL